MSSTHQERATMNDLYLVDGKAELIGGRIVHFMPTGFKPSRVAGRIFRSLDDYADEAGEGLALGDNTGFAVAELPSGRQSFSPDASFYTGPIPENEMRFLPAAPIFAAPNHSSRNSTQLLRCKFTLSPLPMPSDCNIRAVRLTLLSNAAYE